MFHVKHAALISHGASWRGGADGQGYNQIQIPDFRVKPAPCNSELGINEVFHVKPLPAEIYRQSPELPA
jgi:hypothetical protein